MHEVCGDQLPNTFNGHASDMLIEESEVCSMTWVKTPRKLDTLHEHSPQSSFLPRSVS